MNAYDALTAPPPELWLALDEQERIALVMDFHAEIGDDSPNEELHAMFHVFVENQFAEGDETRTRETVERLIREGLDRHDAVHAVGQVLAERIFDLLAATDPDSGFDTAAYNRELDALTAAAWLAGAEQP